MIRKGLLLYLAVMTLASACASAARPTTTPPDTPTPFPPGTNSPAGRATINVAQLAGLREAVRIEILEMVVKSSGPNRQFTITDPQTIQRIVASLDTDLPLQPRVQCPLTYKVIFHLPGGQVEELGYLCNGDARILRGGQDFWQAQDVEPPAEFQKLIDQQVAR